MIKYGLNPPELTEEEVTAINDYLEGHGGGAGSFMPKVCTGPSCEDFDACPLHKLGIPLPVGRQCYIELHQIRTLIGGMSSELGVAKDDTFDNLAISAIAINQTLIKRLLSVMSREPVIADAFRAITPDGRPVFERKAHPALHALDKLMARNQNLQGDLMATRREKSKDDARKRLSPTELAKRLKERMAKAAIGIEQGQKRLKDHYDPQPEEEEEQEEVIEAEFSLVNEKTEEPEKPKQPKRDPETGFLIDG